MAPFAAIFVALVWCTTAVLITWSRGYSPRGIALCFGGIIVGGVGAGLPGAYALTGWNVLIESRAEGTAACAAVLLGALFGLYVTERLRDHQFPSLRQMMTAFFGFLFGLLAASMILFFSYDSWAQSLTQFGLIPATIGTAMLAGSAISHPLPDLD